MLTLVTLLTFASVALAQEELTCTCSLYADSQLDSSGNVLSGSAPLVFNTELLEVVSVDAVCNTPEGTTDQCDVFCQDWFSSNYGEEFGYCNRVPDGSSRCSGGVFCEVLYNDNVTNVEQDQVTMFYRMPACMTSRGNWTDTGDQLGTVLCCEEGLYTSCTDAIDCECYKGEDNEYCECGVFTAEQFEGTDGLTALPLAYVGNEVNPGQGDEDYCFELGSEMDPCRADCALEGELYFSGYSFSDIVPDTQITYGQAYCQGFAERGYDLSSGLTTTLEVYQRAPTCIVDTWIALDPPQTHPETLCCDAQGDYFAC